MKRLQSEKRTSGLAILSVLLFAACQARPVQTGQAPPSFEQVERAQCLRQRQVPDDSEYVVFFDRESNVLKPRAKAILDELAAQWKRQGGTKATLSANKDLSEMSPRDRDLSKRRGEIVVTYLARAGIERGHMLLENHGADSPHVPTPPETQNRGVFIWPSFSRPRLQCD